MRTKRAAMVAAVASAALLTLIGCGTDGDQELPGLAEATTTTEVEAAEDLPPAPELNLAQQGAFVASLGSPFDALPQEEALSLGVVTCQEILAGRSDQQLTDSLLSRYGTDRATPATTEDARGMVEQVRSSNWCLP